MSLLYTVLMMENNQGERNLTDDEKRELISGKII